MEQDTSVDNVVGCEGVGRLCFCQTGVTGLKLRDFFLNILHRRQIEKGREIPGKQFMFVTWFSLTAATFSYHPLAVFPAIPAAVFIFLFYFSSSALKPADLSLPS